MVKIPLLIPPVVALSIVCIWLGSQRQTISALEQESAVLQNAIAARRSGGALDSTPGQPAAPEKLAEDKAPIDWKKIAALFAEIQQGGVRDGRAMMRFQRRLQAMSKEELIATLDEIAALDLPDDTHKMLEQIILNPLVTKDPELALNHFVGYLKEENSSMFYQLSTAMHEWAKKDPRAATAWFDQQIAAGKFDSKSLDGRNRPRLQFEATVISVLLGSDPDAAGRRLADLPANQRDEVLDYFSRRTLEENDQLAFANLVRNQASEKEQTQTIAQQASRLVRDDGFSKVTEFLDRIQATPAERTATVAQAAESRIQSISYRKKVTREDLDSMREWVTAQAPEKTGRVTGTVLAAAQNGRRMEFSEAAELAVEYHDASGNDEVLSAFLEGLSVRNNKEQARLLAEKISDMKRREEILENLK
jgi:hypothetical protein